AESEESDGILFLQPDAGNCAEPEPITRAALDGEDGEISATHPQIGFEAVGTEQASVGKILRCNEDGDGAEEEREAASAEFEGEDGRLHYEKRRSQRGNEANAPERISEDSAADVNQERNEWRLVDVSPGEGIAAGNVVEFIAKEAVAIFEGDVEEKLGEGDGANDRDAEPSNALWARMRLDRDFCRARHRSTRILDASLGYSGMILSVRFRWQVQSVLDWGFSLF